MQQRFLLQILLLAQRVSGTTMPITYDMNLIFKYPAVGNSDLTLATFIFSM